jgi:uncharacterized protein (TIGR03000 family)
MKKRLQIIFIFVAAVLAVAPMVAAPQAPQSATSSERQLRSRVTVILPAEDAELAVNGAAVAGQGESRVFETAPLDASAAHQFVFTVTWRPNGYTTMTRSKTIALRPGAPLRVDLRADDPADRVRVIYVPTPVDVAAAMVELAGVTPDDVVYEPGCGDARITVAAIRRGARRGICVDIDPERARESRSNVETAGFAERIDVREGDALDVRNLQDVSVVLLYMGDHFNMLIRPVLWRELAVGSRIVSHRFTMGDWKPDRTVWAEGETGDTSELHLWTITEEIKRTQAGATGR